MFTKNSWQASSRPKKKFKFSRVTIDQIHEKNNKIIKGPGGTKPLLNKTDKSGLLRSARILPEFSQNSKVPSVNQPMYA